VKQRADRKAAGLCAECGKCSPAANRVSCQNCLDDRNRLTAEVKAAGKCLHCKKAPARSGFASCEPCAKRVSDRQVERTRNLREQVVKGYGHRCKCCGEDRYEFLQIDHVNGDGWVKRQAGEDLTTQQICRKIIRLNFPPDYQILCASCNWSRGVYGYCPHQRPKGAEG